jgi:Lrp/AsnC family transcriptional regulator, regulator of ectoine-degradation genes
LNFLTKTDAFGTEVGKMAELYAAFVLTNRGTDDCANPAQSEARRTAPNQATHMVLAHYKPDETDLRILKRLQMDARVSNVKLAAAVHLSPSACLERLRRLEKAGVIARYVADFDLGRLSGAVMLFVEVVLKNHREADFERFLAAIRRRREVLECFKIGGRVDYLMRVMCRNIAHYNELSDYMSRGELGVEKFHGHVVLATDKAFAGYPLDLLVEPA